MSNVLFSLVAPLIVVTTATAGLAVPGPSATAATPAPTGRPGPGTPVMVPFGDWAPAACPLPPAEDPAPVARLVVHHTHDPVAVTPDEVLPALRAICAAHVARGFSTIGYHYVVDPWGTVYQARGRGPLLNGRAPTHQSEGAHVAGSNAGAVGVAFLGDHEAEAPTAAAVEAAVQLLAWLSATTAVDPGALVTSVSTGAGTARHVGGFETHAIAGHSASNLTACPGEHLTAMLPRLRSRVRRTVGAAIEVPTPVDSVTRPTLAGERPRTLVRSGVEKDLEGPAHRPIASGERHRVAVRGG